MTTKQILRNSLIWGIFLVPFIPLLISGSMFFPFITGKNFAFRIIVEIVFSLWLLVCLFDKTYRPKFSWFAVSVTAFIAIIGIANIFSENPYKSFWSNYERMEGFVTLLHLGAYFFVVGSVLVSEKIWSKFFHVSLGVSFFTFLYGLLQLSNVIVINQGGVRLDATFGNASYLAIYMVFHVFLLLYYYFKNIPYGSKDIFLSFAIGTGIFLMFDIVLGIKNRSMLPGFDSNVIFFLSLVSFPYFIYLYVKNTHKHYENMIRSLLYAVLGFGQLYILYYTATRGAILGLVGGLAVTAVLIAFFGKNYPKIRKISVIGLLTIAIAVVTFIALKETAFVKNSPSLARLASISLKEPGARFMVWEMAWNGFKERPILGWGQESFNFVFNKYYNPKMWTQEQWFDRTHNVIFDWLIAGGILGFLAYMSIYYFFLRYLWRKSHSITLIEKSVITGLLVAYFFHNLFVFDNITSYIMFFSLLAYVHHLHGKPISAIENIEERFSGKNLVSTVSPFILAFFVLSIYFFNIKPMNAATALIQALQIQKEDQAKALDYYKKALSYKSLGDSEIREQLAQEATNVLTVSTLADSVKEEYYSLAKSELLKQIDRSPTDARYHLFLGSFLSRFRMLDEAEKSLLKAKEYSPKKQGIYFELASVYANAGDLKKALDILKEAYELEPSYTEAANIYSVLAIYNGDLKLADEILDKAYGDKSAFDERIIRAYLEKKEYKKVIEILEKKIAEEPSYAQYRFNLAGVYLQAGMRQKAISSIEEAIKVDPSLKEQGEYYLKEIRAGRNP